MRAVGRFCAVPAAVESAETCAVHNSARIIARASLNVGRGFAYHLICSGRILRSAVRLLVHSATRENKPSDLAPYLSSFMSRVCSPFAPMRGGLQRLLV
jgi:hypothetical protein